MKTTESNTSAIDSSQPESAMSVSAIPTTTASDAAAADIASHSASIDASSTGPTITIRYCTQCQWLLRAAWMAQELLSTFSTDLGSVTLVPGTGGVFQIHCNDSLIWDRKRDGGFPEAKVLKQRVRDVVFPERSLGHVDR